jgi:NAD+ diphosphatase
MLVTDTPRGPRIPFLKDLAGRGIRLEEETYLGTLDGRQCFVGSLEDGCQAPEGLVLVDLRSLLDRLPPEQVRLAGRAFQLVRWMRSQRYCGRCGSKTEDEAAERAKRCPSCGLVVYPRISPAIIVAVTRDDRILLARAPRFKDGMYSVLAGFVEPGETLEECVSREVREEVGIEVRNIEYFGSQPWPFPDSLMIGFTAAFAGGEIRADPAELTDARWFGVNELPLVPSRVSIARALIDWFVERASALR